MVDRREIKTLVDRHMTHVLDSAEAALPQERFQAFRRIVLRALGDRGLTADLVELLDRSDRRDWNG